LANEGKNSKKKKNNKSEKCDPFNFEIDEKGSLWNQLRIAWYNYQKLKKGEKKESETYEMNLKSYEVSISYLLKELQITSEDNDEDKDKDNDEDKDKDNDEDKARNEAIKVTVENVPTDLKFKYRGYNGENKKYKSSSSSLEVKRYLIPVLILFASVITITSTLPHIYQDRPDFYEWNFFVYVGMGALAFFALLLHTMKLERPADFSRLHIWEFFALSVLAVSLVLGVVLFPETIFPDYVMIQKMQEQKLGKFDEKCLERNSTNGCPTKEWVLSIGGIKKEGTASGLKIPIYLLVAGNVGAYIRYLYGYIEVSKESRKKERDELINLKELYFNHKKVVNSLCIASGLAYDEMRKKEEARVLKLKHLHKYFDHNRELIYFLPPNSTAKLAKFVAESFEKLYCIEGEYEKDKFFLRNKTYFRTLKTIAAFFLAPLLAVVGWLLFDLSAEGVDWRVYAVIGFTAGLGSNAIIQRIWAFMGEKFPENKQEGDDDEDEPDKNGTKKNGKNGEENGTTNGSDSKKKKIKTSEQGKKKPGKQNKQSED